MIRVLGCLGTKHFALQVEWKPSFWIFGFKAVFRNHVGLQESCMGLSPFLTLWDFVADVSTAQWWSIPDAQWHSVCEQVIIRKRGRLIKLFSLYLTVKLTCMAFENEDSLGSADGRIRLNCSNRTRGHWIRWTACSLHIYLWLIYTGLNTWLFLPCVHVFWKM